MSQRFWGRNVTLSDYVELNPRVNLLRGANVPFVSMDIISPGTRKVYPVQERPASGSGSKFGPGDTLFARITPCLENGKIAQYAGDRAGMGSTEFFVLRARDDISDPAFVYYFSQNPDLRSAAEKSMSGASGRQRAVISSLSEFECEFPPLAIQKRIAGILSAYDELIENSQRRIKILEAMARGLYREWFVHFHFPGHENHPRAASTAGEIPKGWEVKKLGDISSYINRGITPTYDDEGDSIVINQKCVRDQRLNLEPSRKQSKAVSNEKRVCFGDVLINSTGVGTLGRVAQVYENLKNYTVDTHVTIARAKRDIDLDFYGCCLLSLQETFERMGVGATGQTELGRAAISDIDLAIPPIILQQQFGKSVHGIRSAAETYAKKIQNLRRTRDLLLPRLLSGQINVEAAEHV